MKCARCQHESPSGAKFCAECGAALTQQCAGCDASLPPGAKFCPECAHPIGAVAPTAKTRFALPTDYIPTHIAEKILSSKGALEGERKHVTVLFADLKGSMELLADRDAEEARRLLDAVLERMMEAVHHYEGTVNQVMGDGIMALFGAPIAHEDHAVRACYAALRMQQRVRSTRRSCTAAWGSRSTSASASIPVRCWCAPSGTISTWTTRPSGRPPTSPPAWSRWPCRDRFSCRPRRSGSSKDMSSPGHSGPGR